MQESREMMLKLEHVTKYYGQQLGIEDLSFCVSSGHIVSLLGTNGSGKSTTFRLLLGLLQADSGTIEYQGQVIDSKDKCLFGYLPEEKSILRDLKVKDVITYLAQLKKIDKEVIEKNMSYWLDYLHIEKYRNRKVQALSKGNVQLVQLVCALIHDPKILIFDEPLNGLDLENVALFKQLCWKLKKEGKIILISSHQYNNIEDLCDEVVVLHQGHCILKGNLNQLKKMKKQRYITLMNEKEEDFEDEKGILEIKRMNYSLVLKMENEKYAKAFIKKYMKQENISYKIEMISLQQLIQEALDENTHCLLA